ncbi:GNAT family N-acetyltransferase [Specibacter sp. RAF43]|uniref:GNAT family N-acetyltransferase n=1 Tax=Specibacter sp. RAF43 TaxID=3233057 RepID=UPI003F9C0EF4
MTASDAPSLPVAAGLTFRPLTPGDVEPWLALVVRIAYAENAPWHEQRSDLVEVLESRVNPVAENSLLGVDAGGVPRAYGYLAKNPGGLTGYAFGGVDPQWQRRGIGAAVLAWQEGMVRHRFSADRQPAPRLRTYTTEAGAAHRALLTGAGFAVVRYFSEMLRPLSEVPVVPIPDGVRVVPFAAGLGEPVRLAHNEAFADHWGSEPEDPQQWGFLLNHDGFRPDWSSVAVDAATGEVAGYQMSMYDPDRFAKEGRAEGYTELLGVRRAWRGRGIARALLADAMARYKAAGMDHACLDVDTENPTGALGLYERMGYRPLRRTLAWDKALD